MSVDRPKTRRWIWPTMWIVLLASAAALAAFAGWFMPLGIVLFLGAFAAAYAVLSKAIAMNYPAEGRT